MTRYYKLPYNLTFFSDLHARLFFTLDDCSNDSHEKKKERKILYR